MPAGNQRKVNVELSDQTKIEEVFTASYNRSIRVFQANELIRAPKDKLSTFQCKLVRFAIAQCLKQDSRFQPLEIDIFRLAEHLKVPKNHIYERVQKELYDLMAKRIFLLEKNPENKKPRYRIFQWLSYAEYKDGFIYIKLNDALKPYLLGLEKYFTAYLENTIVALDSDLSVKLYEYLMSYSLSELREREVNRVQLSGNQIMVDIEELKRTMSQPGNTKKFYQDNNLFLKRVLEPNLNRISDKTDLQVDYEIRRRKIDGVYHTYIVFTYLYGV